jgi:hypothetical protein
MIKGFRSFAGTSWPRPAEAILVVLFGSCTLLGTGCSGLVQGVAPGGGTPLTISNLAATNATATSVGIDWQTSAASNSQVDYGTTTNYGATTAVDSSMVTSHQVTVSNLKPGTTYHCRVHSTDARNNTAVSGDLSCSTSPDTTPPTVSITSPAANAALSGTVSLTAAATDNVGVASVQFKVDNANTGPAISSAPYSYALNTTALSDGGHTLTAMATDTSGNTATSTGIAVKVNNTVPAPSITSLNPASGLVGTPVTITGANFGAMQGASTVTFNGIAATPTGWSGTSIVAPVPAGATTGNVVVTVGGVASNGVSFTITVPVPSITSLNPTFGQVGTSVTITGTNFGTTQGTSTVKFNGIAATPSGWSGTSVVAPVPSGATTGNVVVTVGGVASSGVNFTVTVSAPSITGLNPTSGVAGTSVTVTGTNFGAVQGTSTVMFNGITATPTSWSTASISVTVPTGATTGNVVVTVGGVASNGVSYTITVPGPSITSLNPASGMVGTPVTIAGINFGSTQGTSTVKFNGTTATPTSWSTASIVVPVPAGATTGNVVITVGGVASNGVGFTVVADTTAPVVTITAPANGATASATITLTATATDPDSPVSFVQFQVDGANTGAQLTTAPYSISLDTTTLSNAAHTLTAVAQDPSGNKGTSAAVTITVSNSTGTGATGPLRALASNPRYFTDGSGKAILLTGSQTWDTFQDTDQSTFPGAFDFTTYVNFLKSHGHNVTILWRKDLPTYCGWGAGGTWHMTPFPWQRTGGSGGTQVASDGLPAFDLTQFNQVYFDRLRSRVIQLQQNGIYAIVELFDGLGLSNNRCSSDGYPFTGGNNVNGVDDGGGANSMTMGSPNTITNYQDAFVQKVIDTLNDQPNVLWEISEEAPTASTWWQGHMISLIHTYETGKPVQHPVGFPYVTGTSDSLLYNSDADWVAPGARISPTSTCGSGTPACKVNINDSDHSYFGMWNDSAQTNRSYVWENFANGNQVMFMDPYLIYWTSGNRNLCLSPTNGVCSGPDSRWNNMRDNLGYTLNYANKMDLAKMTPQGNLSSTGYCLADNVATGAEYLVYAPNGGTFTVNLSTTTRVLNVEWFNPASGTTTTGGTITGGASHSFTAPFSGDAVLYLVDSAGHN